MKLRGFCIGVVWVLCVLGMQLSAQTVSSDTSKISPFDEQINQLTRLSRNNPDSSLQLTEQLLDSLRSSTDSLALAKGYKLLGDVQVAAGQLTVAERSLKKALSLAKVLGDQDLQMRLFNNLGGIYLRRFQDEKSIAYFDSTLQLGRKLLTEPQRAAVMTNIALAQRHLKRYHQAELYHLRALQIYQKHNMQKKIAAEYNNLGILKTDEGKYELALLYFDDALAIYRQEVDMRGQGKVFTNQADVHLLQREPHLALQKLEKALRIKKELDDEVGLLLTYKVCGEAYAQLADLDQSLAHFEMSLALADTLKNYPVKTEILMALASVQERKGNFPAANAYLKEYAKLQDSLHQQALLEELAIAAKRLEISDKDEAIEDLEEQAHDATLALEIRNAILMIGLPFLAIIIVLAIISLRRYKRERKANQILEQQKLEISKQAKALEEKQNTISLKNRELEVAREIIEESNLNLIKANEALEEKVRERSREAEKAYRKLSLHIENTAFVVLEWNGKQQLTEWPEQAEALLGWKEEEMLGLRMQDLPFPLGLEGNGMQNLLMETRLGKGKARKELVPFTNKYGQKVFIEWTHSILRNDSGELESILSFGLDVTEREQVLNELEVAYKELDTFMYKSSHDLRGPVARLQGIINLAKMEVKEEQALTYFSIQQQVTEELNQLLLRLHEVHDIFEHEPQFESVNLYDLAEQHAQAVLQRYKGEQSLDVQNMVPTELEVVTDESLLSLIIEKVLENSIRFAHNSRPQLRFVLAEAEGEKLCLRIVDNGVSIPSQYHNRIFDLFFQGSTRSTGSGLGLYMARKAAKRLKGDIRLLSERELTIFEIELPLVPQEVAV